MKNSWNVNLDTSRMFQCYFNIIKNAARVFMRSGIAEMILPTCFLANLCEKILTIKRKRVTLRYPTFIFNYTERRFNDCVVRGKYAIVSLLKIMRYAYYMRSCLFRPRTDYRPRT